MKIQWDKKKIRSIGVILVLCTLIVATLLHLKIEPANRAQSSSQTDMSTTKEQENQQDSKSKSQEAKATADSSSDMKNTQEITEKQDEASIKGASSSTEASNSNKETAGNKKGEGQNPQQSITSETATEQASTTKTITCRIEIRCDTLVGTGKVPPELEAYVPADGTILAETALTVPEGTTAYDVLLQACRNNGISMESTYTAAYGSYYIKGIQHLYEFDAGSLSGWMYRINGATVNYGCSSYIMQDGDKMTWIYTCDMGSDI